jgi:hypothetical protein
MKFQGASQSKLCSRLHHIKAIEEIASSSYALKDENVTVTTSAKGIDSKPSENVVVFS